MLLILVEAESGWHFAVLKILPEMTIETTQNINCDGKNA